MAGTWLSGEQWALSEQVVRLHVIGASDSKEDQAVKLLARDAVLQAAEPMLEGVHDQREAYTILGSHLGELARAGAAAAGTETTASLEESAWFPTREYDGFALPAGQYPTLKITLGAGEGHNWWCVVFPPLCTESAVELAAGEIGSLSPDQIRLITGEDGGYLLKFKALELWGQWIGRLSQRG